MATKCFAMVRGRAMRATRLDACGSPVLGPDSVVVSEGFITVGYTSNIQEGEVIEITNAAGRICVSDKPAPKFVNYTIAITLCGVEPDLINIFTGNPLVIDDADNIIGFDVNSDVDLDASAFALELWTGVPADACEDGDGQQWGYTITPFIKGGVLGDFTIENAAINLTISGAESKDGSQWGVGPHNVMRLDGGAGAPSPLLDPLSTKNHQRMILTTLAPPTAQCGAQALGVPATAALANGTLTPANSYNRADFGSITGLTASPNTAWTAGQHTTLRDGSLAHWNGTAWATGAA